MIRPRSRIPESYLKTLTPEEMTLNLKVKALVDEIDDIHSGNTAIPVGVKRADRVAEIQTALNGLLGINYNIAEGERICALGTVGYRTPKKVG